MWNAPRRLRLISWNDFGNFVGLDRNCGQCLQMVEALEEKGIPYSYLLFEGEGHGFRRSDTIISAFNAELYFYRKILGIESDEVLADIEIKNR